MALLFDTYHANEKLLSKVLTIAEEMTREELGQDFYENDFRLVDTDGLKDAMAVSGIPDTFRHWSFGKQRLQLEQEHKMAQKWLKNHALPYEMVINSNPCISYNLINNQMPLHLLVIFHAACGHNDFFKNNYMFQRYTDANNILTDQVVDRRFTEEYIERHGMARYTQIMDAAMALDFIGAWADTADLPDEETIRNKVGKLDQPESEFFERFHTRIGKEPKRLSDKERQEAGRRLRMGLPAESLLLFLERFSPVLSGDDKQLLNIVRRRGRYFYPQIQTKVINEGWASFTHRYMTNLCMERGLITADAYFDINKAHAAVLRKDGLKEYMEQGSNKVPDFNPYTLGYSILEDVRRMCLEPTREDEEWFPQIAGCGEDWKKVLLDIRATCSSKELVLKWMSPTVMRDFGMFTLSSDAKVPFYEVSAVLNEEHYKGIRRDLAKQLDALNSGSIPDIKVVDANLMGDRKLKLEHLAHNGHPLERENRNMTMLYVKSLWGFEVVLSSINPETGEVLEEVSTEKM